MAGLSQPGLLSRYSGLGSSRMGEQGGGNRGGEMKSFIYCPYCGTEHIKVPKFNCSQCDLTILIDEKETTIFKALEVIIRFQGEEKK